MTTETEVVRGTAYFVEREPRSRFSTKLRETAFVHGAGVVTPSATVREVLQVDDAYVQSAYSLLRDTLLINDHVDPTLRYMPNVLERLRVVERMNGWRTAYQDEHESATLLGRAVSPPSASLHETAFLSGRAAGGATIVVLLREAARFGDRAYPSNYTSVRDTALLDDAMSSHLRNTIVLRDTALLDDAVTALARIQGGLHEVFQANDWATNSVTWSGSNSKLHEVFYVDDRALPPAAGRAYTCSILTWGMSEYQNYPFLTKSWGYAAGQNLWRLDALDDYGAPLASWITTGKLDLGTSHGKRPSALYAAGSSSEPLAVVVTGDVGGQLASYNYVLDLRDQTNYRNNRAILGKGFRSRYLQFKLQAPKYLGFRLLTAELDIAVSPRRVG